MREEYSRLEENLLIPNIALCPLPHCNHDSFSSFSAFLQYLSSAPPNQLNKLFQVLSFNHVPLTSVGCATSVFPVPSYDHVPLTWVGCATSVFPVPSYDHVPLTSVGCATSVFPVPSYDHIKFTSVAWRTLYSRCPDEEPSGAVQSVSPLELVGSRNFNNPRDPAGPIQAVVGDEVKTWKEGEEKSRGFGRLVL